MLAGLQLVVFVCLVIVKDFSPGTSLELPALREINDRHVWRNRWLYPLHVSSGLITIVGLSSS